MRKTLTASIFALGLGLAGTAFAAHPNSGPGAHDGLPGNQGCNQEDANGGVIELKNPGKLFQWVRETTGQNPHQAAEAANAAENVDYTLGQWIDLQCDDPDI